MNPTDIADRIIGFLQANRDVVIELANRNENAISSLTIQRHIPDADEKDLTWNRVAYEMPRDGESIRNVMESIKTRVETNVSFDFSWHIFISYTMSTPVSLMFYLRCD